MLEGLPVTVDGVNTVVAEAGDELLMGDGVAADLIEAGKAEPVDAAAAAPEPKADVDENDDAEAAANEKPKRRRKPAAKETKDAGAADENKDAGAADENKDGEEPTGE
jgi:hypothetical protein